VTMRARCLSLLVALALGAGCGDDGDAPGASVDTSTTTSTAAANEAPEDFDELAAVFGPVLADTGLELTRAAVYDLGNGPHVALYGVPAVDADAPADYLARLLPSAVAAGTLAFEFDDVVSFDLCQEPTASTEEAPEPRTVVFLTRTQWDAVPDWSIATLRDLVGAASSGEGGEVRVDEEIEELDEWRATGRASG
jgi:hypothetical protein